MILDSSDLQLHVSHGSKEKKCHEKWPVEHRCYNYPVRSGGGLYYAQYIGELGWLAQSPVVNKEAWVTILRLYSWPFMAINSRNKQSNEKAQREHTKIKHT